MTKRQNRNKRSRQSQSASKPVVSPAGRGKGFGRGFQEKSPWLRHPLWTVLSAVVALSAFVIVLVDRANEEHESVAHISVTHTFRSDEPGIWSVISSVRNRGPAVADSLQMIYTAKNSLCFSGSLLQEVDGSARFEADPETRTGADCGGVELVGVRPATQDELPGVFIRDFSSISEPAGLGLASGRIDTFKVGDTGWIEFEFRVAPSLDAEFQQLIPEGRSEGLSDETKAKLIDTFSAPIFQGHKVETESVDFRVARLWTPDAQHSPDNAPVGSPGP